jgi:methionyl-tRNA formyltransferase
MAKNIQEIKIVFMGTSSFADVILNSLIGEKYNIAGVYTAPDKKIGRKQILEKSIVKITAEKNNFDVFQPEKFDETAVCELENIKPDLIIAAAYGKILPASVLEIPKYKCINIHTSLLPKYRGPSPIHNALLEGETETGTTVMLMGVGIDTGDILAQKKTAIHPDELFPELMGKLTGISSSLLSETIPEWISGKIKPQKQDDLKATFCKLIKKNDGYILWSDDAKLIYNKYRSFYSWPGIFAFWENKGVNLRINFRKIGYFEKNLEKERHLGEVFKMEDKIFVQTVLGVIILQEVQMEGKNPVDIKDFINGYPDFIGSVLK